MVKPDVKVNYYAVLELTPDASIDDCKRAYRKLALKWHPDRNRGSEEEAAYRFQAIAAANEVLSDQATKAKYDNDRRRATPGGAWSRAATSAQRPGSYNAPPSAFAPPPRRTYDPTGWANPTSGRPANPSMGSGAERFANFPRPGPTARQGQAEGEKKAAAEAWNYMNASGAAKSANSASTPSSPWGVPGMPQGKPTQANSNAQRRPVPPPPVPSRDGPPQPHTQPQTRRAPDLPNRENPRASRDHGPFGADRTGPTERTAYAHFNPQQRSPKTAQRPGIHRSSTTSAHIPRSRPTGYDPNAANDERAAPSGPSGYSNTQIKDPEPRSSPRAFTPTSPQVPQNLHHDAARRASVQPVQFAQPAQVPYRGSAFTAVNNARPESTAQMRRSQSVRDATKLDTMPMNRSTRAGRQRSMNPDRFVNGRPKSAGAASFNIRDDSDDSTSESSESDESASGPRMRQAASDRARPMRKATGARSRVNGRGTPTETSQQSTRSTHYGSSHSDQSRQDSMSDHQGQPTVPSKTPMYDGTFSSSDGDSKHVQTKASDIPSTPSPLNRPAPSPAATITITTPAPAQDTAKLGRYPKWAIPTSVLSHAAGKQRIPQDDFQQPFWEYAEEPPLIDIDDALESKVNCHTFCTTHCTAQSSESHENDLMELLSRKHPGFSAGYDLGARGQAKSRSTEDINTIFSPTSQPPVFSGSSGNIGPQTTARRSSPSKRGRGTLSSKPSRSSINFRHIDIDPARTPDLPTSGPFGQPSSQAPAGTPSSPFSPDQWQGQHFFGQMPQQPVGASSLPKDHDAFKGPFFPQRPMSATPKESQNDNSAGTRARYTDADAMDIDPPAVEHDQSPPKSSSSVQASSQWRNSQGTTGQTANAGRRRSSARPSNEQLAQAHATASGAAVSSSTEPSTTPTTTELPSLQPLSETLGASTEQGLNDMSSLQDSVPFQSKASSLPPSRLTAETLTPPPAATAPPPIPSSVADLGLPRLPKAPEFPQQWSRASFGHYTAQMHAYMSAMHEVHGTVAQHRAQFLLAEKDLLLRGPGALQCSGEPSCPPSGAVEGGIETYERRVRGVEAAWFEFERIAAEHHRAALKRFLEAKEQVRLRSERGALPDTLAGDQVSS